MHDLWLQSYCIFFYCVLFFSKALCWWRPHSIPLCQPLWWVKEFGRNLRSKQRRLKNHNQRQPAQGNSRRICCPINKVSFIGKKAMKTKVRPNYNVLGSRSWWEHDYFMLAKDNSWNRPTKSRLSLRWTEVSYLSLDVTNNQINPTFLNNTSELYRELGHTLFHLLLMVAF